LLLLLGLVYGLFVLSHLAGCATETVTRSVTLSGTPQHAYTQAAQTFAKMGGQVQTADPQSRVISGVVKGAVQLNITVDEQSTVQATGHVVGGKIAFGKVDEVDTYMQLLQKESRDAR